MLEQVLESVQVVGGSVLTLFLLMTVGFVLGKRGMLTGGTLSQTSQLLLYVVTPAIIMDSFAMERTPALDRQLLIAGAALAGTYGLYMLLSIALFRRRDPDERGILRFASIYGNKGFMGLPLVQAALGSEGHHGCRPGFGGVQRGHLDPRHRHHRRAGAAVGGQGDLQPGRPGVCGRPDPVSHRAAAARPGRDDGGLSGRPEHPSGHGGHRGSDGGGGPACPVPGPAAVPSVRPQAGGTAHSHHGGAAALPDGRHRVHGAGDPVRLPHGGGHQSVQPDHGEGHGTGRPAGVSDHTAVYPHPAGSGQWRLSGWRAHIEIRMGKGGVPWSMDH